MKWMVFIIALAFASSTNAGENGGFKGIPFGTTKSGLVTALQANDLKPSCVGKNCALHDYAIGDKRYDVLLMLDWQDRFLGFSLRGKERDYPAFEYVHKDCQDLIEVFEQKYGPATKKRVVTAADATNDMVVAYWERSGLNIGVAIDVSGYTLAPKGLVFDENLFAEDQARIKQQRGKAKDDF